MEWERVIEATTLLALVMDPLGNIPLFLSVLEKVPPQRRQRVLLRELILALVFLIIFLFTGRAFLSLLGIHQESVSIAGGIIIFLIAVRMVFPESGGVSHSDEKVDDSEPLIVPLAIPFVAGPSAFATLFVLRESSNQIDTISLLLSLLIAWGITSGILVASGVLRRILGRRGLVAVERLMGMILVALAVQMFLDGIEAYLR